MNRSWRTSTGYQHVSNKRPDIIAVKKNGTVDVWEFQSPSDPNIQIIKAKLVKDMKLLPAERRGITEVFQVGGYPGQ